MHVACLADDASSAAYTAGTVQVATATESPVWNEGKVPFCQNQHGTLFTYQVIPDPVCPD